MKQVSALLLGVVLFTACQHPKPKSSHFNGHLQVLVKVGNNGQWQGPILATYDIYGNQDTVWTLFQNRDTVRDVNKKPIFDSVAKSYRFVESWISITPSSTPPKDSVKIALMPN